MRTPVQILILVSGIGGRLSAAGEKLRMELPADCSPELKQDIRQKKSALLKLMRLKFLIVNSRVLRGSFVLFVPDAATKKSLVLAGADSGSIYTRSELGTLVARRVTANELRMIHTVKQQFNGEVRN